LAALPLYVKVELREITITSGILEISVMMSSVMPSEKYSCSGSLDILSKGSTAMEGFSGSGNGSSMVAIPAAAEAASIHCHTRIGRAMFLTSFSPKSSKLRSSRSRTCS
jgi:hypothetical protein